MGPLNGGISPADSYAGFERVRALLKGSYGTIIKIHRKVKKRKVPNFTWAKERLNIRICCHGLNCISQKDRSPSQPSVLVAETLFRNRAFADVNRVRILR